MHSQRPFRLLCTIPLALVALLAVGCLTGSAQRTAPETTPQEPSVAVPAPPESTAEPTEPSVALPHEISPFYFRTSPSPGDETPSGSDFGWDLAQPWGDEPADPDFVAPEESVTGSPLDDLAEITPAEAPVEPAVAEPVGPVYDVPVVLNDSVQFWIEYYTERYPEKFRPGMVRSGRYLPMFRKIFEEEGLPLDLIYMAQVESAFKTNAYSRARALGIWQFIASTARVYGLKIDFWVDERRDPEKSARAAAAYLKKLYADFGDWHLAMAAYNGGEGRVRRALRRTGGTDFWDLAKTRHLKRETRNYVPAILAAIVIYNEPERFGLSYVPDSPLVYDTIEVEGAVDLQVLADCSGSDFDTLSTLNPMLRKLQTPPHAVTSVRVPVGTGEATLAALREVPEQERVLYVRHKVRRGDTLYDIARGYGVSVRAIQQANQLGRRTMIHPNQELVIPTVAAGRYSDSRGGSTTTATPIPVGEPLTYRVRRGDNLSRIASRYGTSASAIAAASGIRKDGILSIGQRLTVVPGERSASRARAIATGETTVAARTGSAPASGVRHTVRRGDTLWDIASIYRTTIESLCALNGISRQAILYPGTVLTVTP